MAKTKLIGIQAIIDNLREQHNIILSQEDFIDFEKDYRDKHRSLNLSHSDYEACLINYIIASKPPNHFSLNELIEKVKKEYFTDITAEEIDYTRKQFYKKIRKYYNAKDQTFDYQFDEDFYQLLLKKKVKLCTSDQILEKLSGSHFNGPIDKHKIDGIYREQYEASRSVDTRYYSAHPDLPKEYFYGEDFYKYLYDTINTDGYIRCIFPRSIIPNLDVPNPEAIQKEFAAEAPTTILKAKYFDGTRKNTQMGRFLRDIGNEMTEIRTKQAEQTKSIIYELENHCVPIKYLPEKFYTTKEFIQKLSKEINLSQKVILQELAKVTKVWFASNPNKEGFPEKTNNFYYNDTFYWGFKFWLQDKQSSIHQPSLDFRFDYPKHPIVYSLPKRSRTERMLSKEVERKLNEFKEANEAFTNRMGELISEEEANNRGDYFVDRWDFERAFGQFIYQVYSRYFESCFRALYRQSIADSTSNEDPEQALQSLYNNYYDRIIPNYHDKYSYEEFKLMMTQQFLYFTNGFRKIRLDLFREINVEKDGKPSRFTGGLLHVLDHFEGFGNPKKGNEQLIPNDLFKNIIEVALSGEIISSVEKKGDYQITLEKECTVTIVEEGKPLSSKKKKFQLVMYYNSKKDLYSITTFHAIS